MPTVFAGMDGGICDAERRPRCTAHPARPGAPGDRLSVSRTGATQALEAARHAGPEPIPPLLVWRPGLPPNNSAGLPMPGFLRYPTVTV